MDCSSVIRDTYLQQKMNTTNFVAIFNLNMLSTILLAILDCSHHQYYINSFISGFATYLAMNYSVPFPPGPYWYCALTNGILFSAFLCGTLLILSMTFDRFYSIIRPHKAASFNTVKRAKITIVCIIIFSIIYNIPHLFISTHENWQCLPYGKAMEKPYGQVYYFFSFVVNYALPFVLLLIMNSVIIHKIRKRHVSKKTNDKQKSVLDNNKLPVQKIKVKSAESQMFALLLLVTFGFLILTTPAYILFLFIMFVDFSQSPKLFAGYILLCNLAHKLYTTNHGINFFFYVISGQKFRTDLMKLFSQKCQFGSVGSVSETENSTISTVV